MLLAEIVGVVIAGAALATLATVATVWIAGPAERLLIVIRLSEGFDATIQHLS